MLMAGGEEVTLLSLGLVVAGGVHGVRRVPEVATLGIHGAVRSDRAVLVVREALRTSSAIAVTGTAPCGGHLGGKKR